MVAGQSQLQSMDSEFGLWITCRKSMAECCCAAVKASLTLLSTVLNVWDGSTKQNSHHDSLKAKVSWDFARRNRCGRRADVSHGQSQTSSLGSAPVKLVLRGTGLHSRPISSFTAALPGSLVAMPVTTSSERLYRLSKTCIIQRRNHCCRQHPGMVCASSSQSYAADPHESLQ